MCGWFMYVDNVEFRLFQLVRVVTVGRTVSLVMVGRVGRTVRTAKGTKTKMQLCKTFRRRGSSSITLATLLCWTWR